MHKFIKGPVKLGKAGKSALKRYLRNGEIRGQEQGLCIPHPGQLHIISKGKAGDPLKLMRQIIAADKKFS